MLTQLDKLKQQTVPNRKKAALALLPLTTLNHVTRWAYIQLRSPHVARYQANDFR